MILSPFKICPRSLPCSCSQPQQERQNETNPISRKRKKHKVDRITFAGLFRMKPFLVCCSVPVCVLEKRGPEKGDISIIFCTHKLLIVSPSAENSTIFSCLPSLSLMGIADMGRVGERRRRRKARIAKWALLFFHNSREKKPEARNEPRTKLSAKRRFWNALSLFFLSSPVPAAAAAVTQQQQ